jgi:hypothetical protein
MEKYNLNTAVNLELTKLALERCEKLIGLAEKDYLPGRSCDYRSFQLKCGHLQDIRVAHYRKSAYVCQLCYEKKLKQVAESQGLKILSMNVIQYSNERMYIRNCGHTEIHSNSYLEKHKVLDCQKCITQEVENNLQNKNFTLLSKDHDGYLVKCKSCNNTTVVRTSVAFSGTPSCTPCFSDLLKKEAITAGFTYLEDKEPIRVVTESGTTIYRWYCCKTCNNHDNYPHISIRTNNVRCKNCYLEKRKSEAKEQGMIYLGWVEGMMHNYRLPCGCERKIQPQAVLKGVWSCRVHDSTHYHRPSGIYLLKIQVQKFSWLKFGYAKDIMTRIKGYGLPEEAIVEIIFNIKVDTGYEALDVEKSIHKDLITRRIDPSFMKENYMLFTGHTECYTIDTSELITSKVKSIYEQQFNLV